MSTTTNTISEHVADMLWDSCGHTLQIVQSIEPDNRLRQLAPGKAHPLWLLGHLSNTLDTIVRGWMFCKEPILSKPQRKMFAPEFVGGNPITDNPDDYLSWEETEALYKKVVKATIEELRNFPDEDLPKPLKAEMPEQFRELFPTAESTLTRMINHDAYHRGQMALINKLPH